MAGIRRNSFGKLASLLTFIFILSGCATIPQGQSSGQEGISVYQDPESHPGSEVMRGGSVIGIENRADETWVEIIDRPLLKSGLPDLRQNSSGRFLAIVPGFLDPLDYSNGRSITIIGTVDGSETRKIAEADYNYPIIAVTDHQLWSAAAVRSVGYRYSSRLRRAYNGYSRYPYRSRLGRHAFGRIGYGFGHRHRHRSRHGSRNRVFISGSSRL